MLNIFSAFVGTTAVLLYHAEGKAKVRINTPSTGVFIGSDSDVSNVGDPPHLGWQISTVPLVDHQISLESGDEIWAIAGSTDRLVYLIVES